MILSSSEKDELLHVKLTIAMPLAICHLKYERKNLATTYLKGNNNLERKQFPNLLLVKMLKKFIESIVEMG